MPFIYLHTIINAPLELTFDVCRDIDVHSQTMQHTNEKAIAGVTSGLININETVTWEARHLFKTRRLTTLISAMDPCRYFKDEMIKGDFKTMWHHHHFVFRDGKTIMEDIFYFESPYGLLGKIVNILFLTRYMRKLLTKRNQVLKQIAENAI